MYQISEEYYNSLIDFKEYLSRVTSDDDRNKMQTYYDRVGKNFSSEDLKIDVKHTLNILVIVATWCYDCKINLQLFWCGTT